MINKDYSNNTEFKAVSCNIVEKIFEARDKILSCADEDTKEDYEDMFKDSFDDWESESYALGECFSFLVDYQTEDCKVVDVDILIYTSEYYLAEEGLYKGVCKLPNGAEIIVFHVYGEESGFNMCQVVYYDGTMLRTFTPYQGNAVNIATKTCLGDETYTSKNIVNDDFFKKVYPNGVDFEEYGFSDELFEKYCVFTGLVESEDDADELKDGRIELDWDAMSLEIEKALC